MTSRHRTGTRQRRDVVGWTHDDSDPLRRHRHRDDGDRAHPEPRAPSTARSYRHRRHRPSVAPAGRLVAGRRRADVHRPPGRCSASGLCDAVVVATPNHTHVDVVGDVLATDLHTLVEKPLCTTVADCQRLIELAADRPAGAITWVGLEYRYMPAAAELVRLVHGGAVGRRGWSRCASTASRSSPRSATGTASTANTGGTLVEKTCHFFDLMNLDRRRAPDAGDGVGAQDVNHLDEVVRRRGPPTCSTTRSSSSTTPAGPGRCSTCACSPRPRTTRRRCPSSAPLGKVEALIPENTVRVGRRGEHWIGGVDSYRVDDPAIAHEGLHHGSSYLEHVQFLDAIRTGGHARGHPRRRALVRRHGRRRPPQHRARSPGRAGRGRSAGRPARHRDDRPRQSAAARRDGLVQRPLRRRLRVPRRARPAAGQLVRALPQHRAHRRPLRVRQRAAAVRLRARDRQHGVRRGDGADDVAADAAGGALRRARRAPARPPAGDDRPDHGRPADRQHHLQRRARGGARQRSPVPALDRDHVRAARAARRAAGRVPRRLRRPRHRPAPGRAPSPAAARCSTSAGCRPPPASARRPAPTCS